MADPVPHDRPLSVEEYLAFERSSPARHEFVEDAPCLVVEVTSPSTARTDRREEAEAYR